MPGSTVSVVRLKVTGQPVCACSARAAASSALASERPISPMAGKRAQRGFKAGALVNGAFCRVHDTMASMAVCRLHRLGPRRARMRETSIA